MIYDLWPSWLPLYVGRYMGAYHTGISAYNKPNSDVGPLEYTFECPHGVVARKKGLLWLSHYLTPASSVYSVLPLLSNSKCLIVSLILSHSLTHPVLLSHSSCLRLVSLILSSSCLTHPVFVLSHSSCLCPVSVSLVQAWWYHFHCVVVLTHCTVVLSSLSPGSFRKTAVVCARRQLHGKAHHSAVDCLLCRLFALSTVFFVDCFALSKESEFY